MMAECMGPDLLRPGWHKSVSLKWCGPRHILKITRVSGVARISYCDAVQDRKITHKRLMHATVRKRPHKTGQEILEGYITESHSNPPQTI